MFTMVQRRPETVTEAAAHKQLILWKGERQNKAGGRREAQMTRVPHRSQEGAYKDEPCACA